MNELTTFNFGTTQVRTARTEQGDPLFCLADICKCLDVSDPSNAARQIKAEFELGVLNTGSFDTGFGVKDLTMLTEPQLYFVMMRSRADRARDFRQWVCNEVLPSIRKTGAYSMQPTQPLNEVGQLMQNAQLVLAAAGIKDNQLALALDTLHKKETGKSLLALTDVKLIAPNQHQLLNPTQIGKEFGWSGRAVNSFLESIGYQSHVAGRWEPTDKGAQYAVVTDEAKLHCEGTVRQLKWDSDIIAVIHSILNPVDEEI